MVADLGMDGKVRVRSIMIVEANVLKKGIGFVWKIDLKVGVAGHTNVRAEGNIGSLSPAIDIGGNNGIVGGVLNINDIQADVYDGCGADDIDKAA